MARPRAKRDPQNEASPLWRIAKVAGCVVAAVLAFSVVALVRSGLKPQEKGVKYTDLEPVLKAVHEAWTSVPGNQPVSAELKDVQKCTHDLDALVAGTTWAPAPSKQDVEKIRASIGEVLASIRKLEVAAGAVDSTHVAKLGEAQQKLNDFAAKLPHEDLSRVDQLLHACAELLAVIGNALVGWPLVTLAGIALLLHFSRKAGGIGRLFQGVASIKFGSGQEITFSSEAAAAASRSANEVFDEYRKKVNEEFNKLATAHNIRVRVGKVADLYVRKFLETHTGGALTSADKSATPDEEKKKSVDKEIEKRWESLRFTVHIEDILFKDTLGQLVDYYPDKHKRGAGRVWSVRYGNIGLAWRLQESRSTPSVSADHGELVRNWGMTRDEIMTLVKSPKSLTDVVLSKGEEPFAIFHIDSDIQNVFELPTGQGFLDASNELHEAVRKGCEVHNLTSELRKIVQRLDLARLDIHIYG